ncbi:MAG: flagellar basal body rod protein FlgB [Marinobacter sp.]|uniref:flagellar basal body rod protein FlgB n=1 Tax=Marinobacter sp. TaxID=50741 RepID=UPI00299E35E0|nr:flagellar basal body rod protein FlgB [Marinobacter sp.]MDX1635612.1 flagellar basal body rod protein FlgB [Marinobacter sp.]
MAINFDSALGIHEHAVNARVRRAEVLANNLANADTPGYKARDIDFRSMLEQAEAASGFEMARSHANHMSVGDGGGADGELLYRVPQQPSVDGNTVDTQQEQSRFMRNAMDFQASFQFLNSKFTGLSKAIKGE